MFKIANAAVHFFKRRYLAVVEKKRSIGGRLKKHLADRELTFTQLVFKAIRYALTRHEIFSRASAIAFCAMLAFIPFITLAITIGAHLLPNLGGHPSVNGMSGEAADVATAIGALFPPDAAALILDQIARIQAQPPLAVISITLFLALWTSSGLYNEIISSLNRILGVPESKPFWRVRLLTMGMVLLQTAVLTIAFVAIVAWPQILAFATLKLGLSMVVSALATVLHWLILFAIIYLSFTIVFHFGPDGKMKHHWVSPGSFFGTVVFLLTTFGFRIYLEHFAQYRTAYGSLGGVMMLMFWLWLMSLVLLISAEINKLAAIAEDRTL
jgi:membrane protein